MHSVWFLQTGPGLIPDWTRYCFKIFLKNIFEVWSTADRVIIFLERGDTRETKNMLSYQNLSFPILLKSSDPFLYSRRRGETMSFPRGFRYQEILKRLLLPRNLKRLSLPRKFHLSSKRFLSVCVGEGGGEGSKS